MINKKRLIKAASAWISIVYTVCYAGVALWPSSRDLFMKYSLHANVALKSDFFGFWYFIFGLIAWNITVIAGVWLFATLFNKAK